MPGHTKWTKIRDAGGPVAAEPDREMLERDEAYRASLKQLRAAREMTQTELARELGISQAEVSRIESRTDLFLSTLAKYVEGIGGRLELTAVFDDHDPIPLFVGPGPGPAADPDAALAPVVSGGTGAQVKSIEPAKAQSSADPLSWILAASKARQPLHIRVRWPAERRPRGYPESWIGLAIPTAVHIHMGPSGDDDVTDEPEIDWQDKDDRRLTFTSRLDQVELLEPTGSSS